MDRGKISGAILCVSAVALTLVFLWGIASQEYWAIAIPVAVGVVVAMTLLFWVGWTFIITDAGPPSGDDRPGAPFR